MTIDTLQNWGEATWFYGILTAVMAWMTLQSGFLIVDAGREQLVAQ